MIDISLAHLSMIDATPEQLVDAAAAGGFQGVGLRIHSSSGPLPGGIDLVRDREARARLQRRLANNGLRVFDVEAFVLLPATNVRDFEPALDTAAELGAGSLLCVGGDDDPDRLRDTFIALADLAQTRGIVVGLEFIPYMSVKTLGAALNILRVADRPNAALLLDVLHLSRSRGKPEDLEGLGSRDFAFIQFCDARAAPPLYEDLPSEARTDRLHPGEGGLWLDRLLPYFPPDKHLSIEAPVKADAGLPFEERAQRLGRSVRDFLARHDWP